MRIHSSNSIGRVLREAREGLRLSQGDLAALLGISPSCLNRVEHGKRAFDTDWMVRMPSIMCSAVRSALLLEFEDVRGPRVVPRFRRRSCPLGEGVQISE